MTKRADLLRKIEKAARKAGLKWVLVRQGKEHAIYSLDGLQTSIGLHNELGNRYRNVGWCSAVQGGGEGPRGRVVKA